MGKPGYSTKLSPISTGSKVREQGRVCPAQHAAWRRAWRLVGVPYQLSDGEVEAEMQRALWEPLRAGAGGRGEG